MRVQNKMYYNRCITKAGVKRPRMSHSAFDDFVEQLELPQANCDQIHPSVEQFVAGIDPSDPDWVGHFSDWMDQADSCLTNEVLDTIGEPPDDPDDLQNYLWSLIRISWLFYRKYNDGEPFNT